MNRSFSNLHELRGGVMECSRHIMIVIINLEYDAMIPEHDGVTSDPIL